MLDAKIKYAFILQILIAAPSFADNWSINEKSDLPAQSDENRIIKWCDDKGKIRFSSANIRLKGYKPCGLIVNTETCDGENNKILGNKKSGIFKSCEKNDKKGLSHRELKDLKFAMKKAAKKQNSDPEVQLQLITDKLLTYFTGGDDGLNKLINTKEPQKLMKTLISELEKSTPLLDPETKKLVEPLLKNLKQAKY